MKDLLLGVHVVVKTLNLEIHAVVWQTTSKNSTKVRAARAARLFFLIYIQSGVVVAVAVAVVVALIIADINGKLPLVIIKVLVGLGCVSIDGSDNSRSEQFDWSSE